MNTPVSNEYCIANTYAPAMTRVSHRVNGAVPRRFKNVECETSFQGKYYVRAIIPCLLVFDSDQLKMDGGPRAIVWTPLK